MSAHLRKLQGQIDSLRNQLGVSDRGQVIYRASRDVNDELVVVEADGFGGATAKVVEGNYPLDFFTSHEKTFPTEAAAMEAAEIVVDDDLDPADVLG